MQYRHLTLLTALLVTTVLAASIIVNNLPEYQHYEDVSGYKILDHTNLEPNPIQPIEDKRINSVLDDITLAEMQAINNPVEECTVKDYYNPRQSLIVPQHPQSKQLADQLTTESMSDWGKAEAITNYIIDKFIYELSASEKPTGNMFMSGEFIGDCSEITHSLVTLFRSAGLESYAVIDKSPTTIGGEDWYHEYPIVKLDGFWISLEPTNAITDEYGYYTNQTNFVNTLGWFYDTYELTPPYNKEIFNEQEAFKCK